MSLINKVQLITYPDSLGKNLQELQLVLQKYFPNSFPAGIHLLPPFPSSSDRGYAPISYFEIDPKFGSFTDIKSLGQKYPLMIDLIVNHISRQSEFFQDFLKKGRKSDYTDMFITLDKLWNDGKPVESDIQQVFLRRKLPFSTFETGENGELETVWTTFGKQDPSEQIDVDVHSQITRRIIEKTFEFFKDNEIRMIRLDAVGYVIKKLQTTCFFIKPEIDSFLEWIMDLAKKNGITLLPEVHSHHSIQEELSEKGLYIYDFILPYLVLEAIINKNVDSLVNYLNHRSPRQFTMLDCHDGVPVKPDLDGLVDSASAKKIVDICVERGANLSYVISPSHKSADGFDVHQIRGTYYSLLNNDDDAYIAARAIQLFTPGIPQIYYVGLLAGKNDVQRAEAIGDGREINRHNYSLEEIEQELQRPVVARLQRLIELRNSHPAFDGTFKTNQLSNLVMQMIWSNESHYCELMLNLNTMKAKIKYSKFGCQIVTETL